MLSNMSKASNSRKQRWSDICSVAKQLNMEGPIQKDGEDFAPEQEAPIGGKYPDLNRNTTYECINPFEAEANKSQDQPPQKESSSKAVVEQPQQTPDVRRKQHVPNMPRDTPLARTADPLYECLMQVEEMFLKLLGVRRPVEKATLTSYADSPFADAISLVEIAKRFIVLVMKLYDRTTDPGEKVA